LAAFWEFFSEIDYLIRTAPCRTIVRDLNLGAAAEDIWINLHVVYWKFGIRILF